MERKEEHINYSSIALDEGRLNLVRKRRTTKRRVRRSTSVPRSAGTPTELNRESDVGIRSERHKRTIINENNVTETPKTDMTSEIVTANNSTIHQIRQMFDRENESVRTMTTEEDARDVVRRLRSCLSRLELSPNTTAYSDDSSCSGEDLSNQSRLNVRESGTVKGLQSHLKLNLKGMSRSANCSPVPSACGSPIGGSPNRSRPRLLSYSQSALDVSPSRTTTTGLSDDTDATVLLLDRSTSFDTARRRSSTPLPRRSSSRRKLFGSPRRFNMSMLTPRSPKKSPKTANVASSPLSSPASHKSNSFRMSPVDLTHRKVHLKRLIGHGGTSLIYEATVDGWTVAAKVYHQYFPADDPTDRQRERIQLILNALCALPRHPNMLPLLGYTFLNENRLVVLCERVDCTLRDLIDSRRAYYYTTMLPQHKNRCESQSLRRPSLKSFDSFSSVVSHTSEAPTNEERQNDDTINDLSLPSLPVPPFTIEEILGLWKQVVEGVAFLHRLPEPCSIEGGGRILAVWHRDLKSENVMCTRLGADLDEVLSEQEADSRTRSRAVASARIACDITGSGLFGSDAASDVGSLHKKFALKLGDFDEMHVVYDIDDKKSPIKWQEGLPDDAHGTTAEASSGRVMRRSKPAGRQPFSSSASYERLSLNVGTLEFMAPEMADRKTALYDESVDVWSLGMVLYELMTLELPYGRDCYTQFELPDVVKNGIRPTLPTGYLRMMEQHENQESLAHETAWREVLVLFVDCTRRCPQDRPSAFEVLRRIDAILSGFTPSQ